MISRPPEGKRPTTSQNEIHGFLAKHRARHSAQLAGIGIVASELVLQFNYDGSWQKAVEPLVIGDSAVFVHHVESGEDPFSLFFCLQDNGRNWHATTVWKAFGKDALRPYPLAEQLSIAAQLLV